MDHNSDNNVFRFSVLRPTKSGHSDEPRPIERRTSTSPSRSSRVERARRAAAGPGLNALRVALKELAALDYATLVKVNGQGITVLNEAGLARISSATAATASSLGYPLETSAIEDIYRGLIVAIDRFDRPGGGLGPIHGPSGNPEPAKLRAAGISELLVVKQQIKRYEPGEIAYIENVLAGETKSRVTRSLDRIEEELISVEERERDRETETQSTERFELNRETTRTQENDRKIGFGLSLSGRYGPSVEFTSNLEGSSSSSETLAQTVSVQYAKEVVERSKERIVESVRHERRVTVLREVEETTDRSFKNDGPEHRSGSYQFVDKIYESQVFNYGLRQIFDFMVPEPASYLWYLEHQPNPDIEIPTPPIPLETEVTSALDISEGNYARLAARYGAQGVKPPPILFTRKLVHLAFGTGGEDSEGGQPMGRTAVEMEVPDGYRPWFAVWSAMGTTDDTPTLAISVGHVNDIWRPAGNEFFGLQEDDYQLFRTLDPRPLFGNLSDGAFAPGQKLSCELIGFETANFAADVVVHFSRSVEEFVKWQHATYDTIADGYANAMLRYDQDLEAYRQRQAADAAKTLDFGENPSINQQIVRKELKKHCLAFIRNQHVGDPATEFPVDNPPEFDIEDALDDGLKIKFLELAFEWEQMQYVFYPYFWARGESWASRFRTRNVDPDLEEFLKAGYARAVVPVRPGFEEAVSYFMETGKVYSGNGDPTVHDPLYTSIVTEIKERTDAGQGEIAVGEPWETRMPTSLLYVRASDALPKWRRDPPTEWHWVPDN